MKDKSPSFYSIVALALTLILLVVITQFFTNKSTSALTSGNIRAVETIRLNNSIQELVNLSFDLESKLIKISQSNKNIISSSLNDSLTMLGYNASVIASTNFVKDSANNVGEINNVVETQISISENLLTAVLTGKPQRAIALGDSLLILKIGSKVYENCKIYQETLNRNLQKTLTQNSELAIRLTLFNRILAIVTVIAILSFATIIIRKQTQQYELIVELKAAELAALKGKQAKDDFLANMSHELRTPLNALIGFGNLLNETPLNKDQKEYVDVIKSSGYNLLCIVNDVLDLSKIEAGKLTIAHKPFNLYDLFTVIEKMFSASIKEKGLYYATRIDEQIPQHVIGDPDRLQQIFINLISNAIKFTNAGGIEISAGIIWEDEDNKFYKLSFTVKDTGIGIPRDQISRVFERFEQLEQGALRKHGGTGLGLTIVKNLVGKMGGAISVYSEENEGSEFNFTCIIEKSGIDTVDSEHQDARLPEVHFSGYRVLIVEDNKANQTLLKHILKKYQLTPTIVENGKDAISILEENRFDLVFMDIQMPVMDGYTAINILRKEHQIETPIIAMTAYVSEIEISKCLSAGFSDYIAKPINEIHFIQKTALYLNHTQKQPVQQAVSKIMSKENLSFLMEIVGDDPDAIKEIITEMQLQWEKDKDGILLAIKENDITLLNQILHRMKSTFSSLGPDHIIYRMILERGSTLHNKDGVLVDNCYAFIETISAEIM